MNKTLSGRPQELKNKVQSWVIPKVVAVAYESFSLQSLKRHSSERGYTEVVITRAGRLPDHEWLRRSLLCFSNSVSVSCDVGKVKVKDTMDGFFGAIVSMTSPSWIQLFICLDVPLLCVFLIVFHIFLLLPRVKINFVICAWSWGIDKLWINSERLVSLH